MAEPNEQHLQQCAGWIAGLRFAPAGWPAGLSTAADALATDAGTAAVCPAGTGALMQHAMASRSSAAASWGQLDWPMRARYISNLYQHQLCSHWVHPLLLYHDVILCSKFQVVCQKGGDNLNFSFWHLKLDWDFQNPHGQSAFTLIMHDFIVDVQYEPRQCLTRPNHLIRSDHSFTNDIDKAADLHLLWTSHIKKTKLARKETAPDQQCWGQVRFVPASDSLQWSSGNVFLLTKSWSLMGLANKPGNSNKRPQLYWCTVDHFSSMLKSIRTSTSIVDIVLMFKHHVSVFFAAKPAKLLASGDMAAFIWTGCYECATSMRPAGPWPYWNSIWDRARSGPCFKLAKASMPHVKSSGGRKEGRFNHPWQPARLIGWNSVWVGQCDISAITSCQGRLWYIYRPHAGPWPKGAASWRRNTAARVKRIATWDLPSQGIQATYASHHLMHQYCTSCRHDWPEAEFRRWTAMLTMLTLNPFGAHLLKH